MAVALICDFHEFYPTRRNFTTSTSGSTDVSRLEKVVSDCLHDWLPNLPSNSTVEIASTDISTPENLTLVVTVSHVQNRPYAIQTKWTTAAQLMSIVKPGDKIEMKGSTSGGLSIYSHFAVYTGFGCDGDPDDHDITHLAPPADCFGSELALSSKYAACVQSDNLISYAKDRLCRINNLRDLKNEPRPGDLVANQANCSRDAGVGRYSLLKNNCEHFVNDCRYGESVSDQVDQAMIAAGVGSVVMGILTVVVTAILTKFILGPKKEERRN